MATTIALLLVPLGGSLAAGCVGPAGPPGPSDASQVSCSPTPPLAATSTNVQAALDDMTTKFLPLTGGTVGRLTVSGGRLDGPLSRSRLVVVGCSASSSPVPGKPTCNGDPACAGFTFTQAPGGLGCLGQGSSAACGALTSGTCTAYCPDGYRFAVSGGCSGGPVDYCLGIGTAGNLANPFGWYGHAANNATVEVNAYVTCLQVK